MDEHVEINAESRWSLELDKAQGVRNREDSYQNREG